MQRMLEASISYLAWFGVYLIQAMVHYFIFGTRRRADEEGRVPEINGVPLKDENEQIAPALEMVHESRTSRMIPHATSSEDEDEEDESFDGDEPQIFFELLKQTGSEMMRVRCTRSRWNSLRSLTIFCLQQTSCSLLFRHSRVELHSRL